jgi:hypothetical protein
MPANFAAHGTLTANTQANVELANNPSPGVTVSNRTLTSEIWITVAEGTNPSPTAPSVAGNDVWCLPIGALSITIPIPPGPCVVSLITPAGAPSQNYSVQGLA